MAGPILPRDLPAAGTVNPGASIIVDGGTIVEKATPIQVVDAARPLASEAEAIAGTDNTKIMTPLRVAQAIPEFLAGLGGAPAIGTVNGDNVQLSLGWKIKPTSALTADEAAAVALDAGSVVTATIGSDTWLKRDNIPLSLFADPAGFPTDNAAGFNRAAEIAARLGIPLLIDGGSDAVYNLTHALSNPKITAHNDVMLVGDGATLFLNGTGVTGIFGYDAPTRAAGLTMVGNTTKDATAVTLTAGAVAANNIAVGDVVYIDAPNVFVCSTRPSFPYQKQTVRTIESIAGDTLNLAGPPFIWFFLAAEVSITVYAKRKITMQNVRIGLGAATQGRFDIRGFAEGDITDFYNYGSSDWSSGVGVAMDGLQIFSCCNIRIDKAYIRDMRYGIAPALGSWNTRVTNLFAERCRHTVDVQSWAVNTVVDGFTFKNNFNAIEYHASLAGCYMNGISYDVDPSFGIRGSGNCLKNIEVYGINGASGLASATFMGYDADYEYLFEDESSFVSDALYENVIAPNTELQISETNDVVISGNCELLAITIDGVSNEDMRVHIGPEVKTINANNLRRVEVIQLGTVPINARRDETPSGIGSIAITGITNTNPAVVSFGADHNFPTKQRITILGVTGMPEAIGNWNLTWVSATSFSIPLDATALGAAAGGTAELTRIWLRPDDTAGIGSEVGVFKRRLRQTPVSDNTRELSIKIPMRLFPDPMNANAIAARYGIIRVTADSRHDGLRIQEFPFQISAAANAWLCSTAGVSIHSLTGSVGATLAIAISNVTGSYSASADLNFFDFELDISGLTSGGVGGLAVPIIDMEVKTFGTSLNATI